MYCTKHPNLAANIKCTSCSRWICYMCSKVINGKSICTECQKKQSFYFSRDENFTKEQTPIKKEPKININPAIIGQGLGLPWHQNVIHKKTSCAYHPSREGIKKCDKCNKYVCSNCLRVDDQTDIICYVCWYKMPGSTEGLEDIQDLEAADLTTTAKNEIPEGLDEYIKKEEQPKIELNLDFQEIKEPEKIRANSPTSTGNWFTNLDLSEEKEETPDDITDGRDNDTDISIITTILNDSEPDDKEEIDHILSDEINEKQKPDDYENINDNSFIEKEHCKNMLEQFEEEDNIDKKLLLLEGINLDPEKSITEYISKLIIENPFKEVREKAAELVAERMDDTALDYLLKGIKQEQDGQVRKAIARAYSKVKYKKH